MKTEKHCHSSIFITGLGSLLLFWCLLLSTGSKYLPSAHCTMVTLMKITTNKLTGQYKKFIQPIHSLEFFITNFNAFQINIKKITKIFFTLKLVIMNCPLQACSYKASNHWHTPPYSLRSLWGRFFSLV